VEGDRFLMTIPEIREALIALSADTRIPPDVAFTMRQLALETKRRRPRRVAVQKCTPATPKVRAAIRLFAAANPKMSQLEIGRHFNVNPGRVSEALRGFRR
jgi:hypothetical protein